MFRLLQPLNNLYSFYSHTLTYSASHKSSLHLWWPVCSISSRQTTSVLSCVSFKPFVMILPRKPTVVNASDPSRLVWVFKGPGCRSGSRMVLMWLVKQKDRLVGVAYLKNKQAENIWNKQTKNKQKISGSLSYLNSKRDQSVFSGQVLVQCRVCGCCTPGSTPDARTRLSWPRLLWIVEAKLRPWALCGKSLFLWWFFISLFVFS